MIYGAGMILLLIFLGGLIAYIGDRVGMKVGKRRVSIFGLRPKHTSIIVTIVTGIVIVSLTLGVLLAISQQARTAFFGIQNLIRELKDTEASLASLQGKYDREEQLLKQSIADSVVAMEKSKAEMEESRVALQDKQDELDNIIGDINIKSLELGQLQDATDEMARKVLELHDERRELEKTKENLLKQIEGLEERYASMLSDAQTKVLHGDIIYTKDEPLQRIVIRRGIARDELKNMLTNVLNNIFWEAIEAGATVDEDGYKIFDTQFESLMEEVKRQERDILLEIRSHTNVLSGESIYVSFKVLEHVFKSGQILAKETIKPGLPQEDIGEIMKEMLRTASQRARSSGMVPDPVTGRVGAVPFKRFDDVVKELSAIEKARIVTLYVVDDTGIADRLNVDFKIN